MTCRHRDPTFFVTRCKADSSPSSLPRCVGGFPPRPSSLGPCVLCVPSAPPFATWTARRRSCWCGGQARTIAHQGSPRLRGRRRSRDALGRLLFARSIAFGAARQDCRQPPPALCVRCRSRAYGPGRIERGASVDARTQNQREPPHCSLRRAFFAAYPRTGTSVSNRRVDRRAAGRGTTPRSVAGIGRGRHARVRSGASERSSAQSCQRTSELARCMVVRGLGPTAQRTTADDAADGRAHRASVRSAERGSRHHVLVSFGRIESSLRPADARNAR